MDGVIYRINVKPKIEGERGIPKSRVGYAYLFKSGFEGDYNHFRTTWKAGTLNRAVLVFPIESIYELNDAGWPVEPGHLGENLTTQGISYEEFVIGRSFNVGQAVIEISKACKPCKVLANLSYVGKNKVKDFIKTLVGRRGWYARVIRDGKVMVNDPVRLII